MLFQDTILYSTNIAVKKDSEQGMTYAYIYEKARAMSQYKNKRQLTCVVCSGSFESVVFILQLFMLKQPMILLPGDMQNGYLDEIRERFHPGYLWKDNQLTEIAMETGKEDNHIHPDLAVLLSTSGSMGTPKLVKISYDNILAAAAAGIKAFHITSMQKGILILPVDHVLGLMFCFYHWLCGAAIVVTPLPFMSKEFERVYDRENINNIAGIPFVYRVFKKTGFWENAKRRSALNSAITAGAKLEESLRQSMVLQLDKKFKVAYGQTETTGAITSASFQDIENKDGVIGKAMEGASLYVHKGELIVQSECVCLGYAYGVANLSVGDENHGVIATGDLAEMDDEQMIFLRGRKKRFIKILGHRYQLDELELLLSEKIPDYEFACSGLDDDLRVFVECGSGEKPAQIIDVLHDIVHIPLNMIHIQSVEKIPRSSTGKILYAKL